MKKLSECLVFGGKLQRFEHDSEVLHCKMVFSLFTPPNVKPAPVLWYLSGLTCTDQNFVTKGTVAFRAASESGVAIVAPDTSPRIRS